MQIRTTGSHPPPPQSTSPTPPHLVQLLAGEVGVNHDQAILLLSKVPHPTVGLPVVEGQRGEVVEGGVKVVGHMGWGEEGEEGK